MQNKEHISPSQLFCVAVMAIYPTIILMVPSQLLKVNGDDAPWAALLAALTGAAFAWVSTSIHHKFPQYRITTTFVAVLGRWAGWLLCFIFLSIYFGAGIAIFREFGEMASWAFAFGDIPIGIFLIMGGINAFYLSYHGIEAIARLSQLMLPISVLAVFVMFVSAIPWMNWKFVLPPLPEMNNELLRMTLHPLAFFAEGFLLGTIYPYVQPAARVRRSMLYGTLMIGAIFTVTMISLTAYFGGTRGGNMTFPLLHLSKEIRYGIFLSHLQVIMVPFLVSVICIKQAIFVYTVSLGFRDLFRLKDYRPLSLFITVIYTLLASLLFNNASDLWQFMSQYLIYKAFPILLAVTGILYIAVLLTKKNRSGATQHAKK